MKFYKVYTVDTVSGFKGKKSYILAQTKQKAAFKAYELLTELEKKFAANNELVLCIKKVEKNKNLWFYNLADSKIERIDK